MEKQTGDRDLSHPAATLSARGAERARAGHLWIYRSDVAGVIGASSGDVVRVDDRRGNFIGWAHYGAESEITLRILSQERDEIDREFWRKRLEAAIARRELLVGHSESHRVVHAEGDLLPGLIVDRYGQTLVLQTLTRGMEVLKPLWVELLVEAFHPRLIVERNDVKVRILEGLPQTSGVIYSATDSGIELDATQLEVAENGLRFIVDLIGGQKTGAFLDQRENRLAAMQYGRGRGLDCFSFHGSFAIHLAQRCDQVTAIDISLPAIERARRNAELNGLTNIKFIEGNVFDELHRLDDEGEHFDTIVLDPPAFAKNRRAVEAALRGYKEINLRALRLLSPGGMLITCSCSYHISKGMFLEAITEAARDSHRQVQIVEERTQARDHPILLAVPETCYLKCLVLRVIQP